MIDFTLNGKKAGKNGFTLVEMLIAVAVFTIIMVMAVGSLLSILDANRQAQAKKTVVNNLNFALENMTRNIRTGRIYHCVVQGEPFSNFDEPRDCPAEPSTAFAFTSFSGEIIVYRYNSDNKSVERSIEGGVYLPITAPEVEVDQMRFFVSGANSDGQPRVLLLMHGIFKGKTRVTSEFDIETLISQRLLDI